jgi:hypothetical protein
MRLLLGVLLGASFASLSACVISTGDFDGIGFWPGTSSFAVADRNDLTWVNKSLVATGRAETQKSATLYMSAASADVEMEWRHFSTQTLLQLKKDLALQDGLLWTGIPLSEVVSGAKFEVQLDDTGRVYEEGSQVHMVLGPPSAKEVEDQGFGNLVELILQIDDATTRPGGQIVGSLEIKRGRGEDQDGEVATGEVTIAFRIPVIAERLGKSNLSIAGPIMRCAARNGPTGAGNCRHEEPDGYLGATGLVTGEP